MALNASVPLMDHLLNDPAQVFNTRYFLYVLVNIPILAVVFNILRQMASVRAFYSRIVDLTWVTYSCLKIAQSLR